jgi:hypothetical protein
MNDSRLRARRAPYTPSPSQQVRITEEEMMRDGVYEDRQPDRLPSSIRRYPLSPDVHSESSRRRSDSYTEYERQSIPPRRSATQTNIPAVTGGRQSPRSRAPVTDDSYSDYPVSSRTKTAHRGISWRWFMFVALAMVIMLLGWMMFSMLGNWWTTTQNDWQYGRPRTYQVDAVVGHNDSPSNPSHFIAINLNRQIIVIEIPGGDASKARIFVGPTLIGPGQELTPVTLTFEDVTHDGKLDMVINVQDAHFVFLNENGTFKPAPGQY